MKWTEKNERRFNELLEKKKQCEAIEENKNAKKLFKNFVDALNCGDLDFYLFKYSTDFYETTRGLQTCTISFAYPIDIFDDKD